MILNFISVGSGSDDNGEFSPENLRGWLSSLSAADKAIGLTRRFCGVLQHGRDAGSLEHTKETLVGQRVFGIALGYEVSTTTTPCTIRSWASWPAS